MYPWNRKDLCKLNAKSKTIKKKKNRSDYNSVKIRMANKTLKT